MSFFTLTGTLYIKNFNIFGIRENFQDLVYQNFQKIDIHHQKKTLPQTQYRAIN